MRLKQNEIKQNKIYKVLIICFSQLQHTFKRETMFFCLWFLKLRKSNISRVNCVVQKQPSRGGNMQQIYRRTPMPKRTPFRTPFLKNISGSHLLFVVISLDISQTKLDKLDHSFNNMFNKIKYYFLGEFRGYPTPLTCSKNLNLWSFEQSVNLRDLILLNLPDLLFKT